ncbi:type II toxin-antitoxin system RelE/ParE family toxin [Candidatus Saccharibacteria bacterium]|nr:type II toxin-antitoxin system RelE/ParE family toxin [Candidatus Saccharibacteria bacterium]
MPGSVYKIVVSETAEKKFADSLDYILYNYCDIFAIHRMIDDYEETLERLSYLAGSLGLSNNPKLAKNGYGIIHFKHYKYYMVYRVNDKTVEVIGIYHTLEDADLGLL